MIDVQSLTKYLLEGLAVAAAAFYIPRKNVNLKEVAMIALTAAAVFAILDQFSPSVAGGARSGSGFGIGYNLVREGFNEDGDSESSEESSEESDGAGAGDNDGEGETNQNATAPPSGCVAYTPSQSQSQSQSPTSQNTGVTHPSASDVTEAFASF